MVVLRNQVKRCSRNDYHCEKLPPRSGKHTISCRSRSTSGGLASASTLSTCRSGDSSYTCFLELEGPHNQGTSCAVPWIYFFRLRALFKASARAHLASRFSRSVYCTSD